MLADLSYPSNWYLLSRLISTPNSRDEEQIFRLPKQDLFPPSDNIMFYGVTLTTSALPRELPSPYLHVDLVSAVHTVPSTSSNMTKAVPCPFHRDRPSRGLLTRPNDRVALLDMFVVRAGGSLVLHLSTRAYRDLTLK